MAQTLSARLIGLFKNQELLAMRCLVSIPPVLRGVPFSGSDPASLQQRLIRSWMDAGFAVVSLNTPSELKSHPTHEECLRQLGVDVHVVPSSEGDFPAYLPNLRESLRLVSQRFPGEVLAITNADIHIQFDSPSQQRLARLAATDFLLAHRTDVEDESYLDLAIAERRGQQLHTPFLPGIDFIAARAETFKQAIPFLSPDLTIGLPWWDLLLPMALMAAGATRSFLASDQFLHTKHQERWDPRWLDQVGSSATRFLHRQIKAFKAPASSYVWSLAYSQITSPVQSLSVYKSRFITRIEHLKQRRRCPASLMDTLRLTEALVCEQGWDLDKRWIGSWYQQ